MNRIKVAHLIYSEKVGGSEVVAGNVCSYLDRSIFDPLVLFMLRSQGGMPEILRDLHVPYKRLNMLWRSIPLESLYFAYLLNKMEVDILHVHHIPLYLRVAAAVRMSRVKGVVFTEHAKFSIEQSKYLQNGCGQAAQHANTFITVVSHDLKKYFVRNLNIASSSVKVVLNGVDIKRFNPERKNSILRSMLPEDFTGKILMHVGRMAEAKDHKTLLGAMKQIVQKGHDVFLFLVGDGELRAAIEQQISDLGLNQNVNILGMRSDVDQLLLGADVFVMSSKREGLPMVLMEAMSCGLPVVSTDVGGISEIVKDQESGLLVEPDKPDSLAKAIKRILSRPEAGKFMGEQARKIIIENYSLEATAKSYVQLYDQILSN